jgi:hydrogenase expression/formation protein HypE
MLNCPLPFEPHEVITLAHGGGGKRTAELIERLFYPAFENDELLKGEDAAELNFSSSTIAMSTDSFVVNPLLFPGGDIGKLAVYGTVNDLAMKMAIPRYLSASFILEEGLKFDTLWKIVASMAEACSECGVHIVTGDTKVVEKGKGDGIFINTTGVGELMGKSLSHRNICVGDSIIVSGDLGRHGATIMGLRHQLESDLTSDCANLFPLVDRLYQEQVKIKCLRDITRGGIKEILNEFSSSTSHNILVDEEALPYSSQVLESCELLGLDPSELACEGRFAAVVAAEDVEKSLDLLGEDGREIAKVVEGEGRVYLESTLGVRKRWDRPMGMLLPRIC